MKVTKIQFKTSEFTYFRSDYIPNLVLQFADEQGLEIREDGTLILKDQVLDSFYLFIGQVFTAFLEAHYTMPPHKHMYSNPGRFERFVFSGKKYVVNYRTDPDGITAYSFNSLLRWTKRLIEDRGI